MKRVITICAVLSFFYAGLAVETDAEVRVRTRPDGEYLATTVVPGGPPWRPGVWSARARLSMGLRGGSAVLNPLGDRFGDLIPTLEERAQPPHHPWAVWSRFNGTDYDLVYSSWTYAWSSIRRVTREILRGDDLNPSLAFTTVGQPLIAWENRDLDDGHGSVYVSLFAAGNWTDPLKISDDSVGGRRPTIEITNDTIVIHYYSDDASRRISHPLVEIDPTTITDDIDPQAGLTDDVVIGDTPKEVTQKN